MLLLDLAKTTVLQDLVSTCKTHHMQDRARGSCKYLQDKPKPLFGMIKYDGVSKILQE